MHPIEEATVRAFISQHRQSRWLLSLGDPKRRRSFLDALNHCKDIDPRHASWVASNVDIADLLRLNGAPPMCYLISDANDVDGQEMALVAAVEAVAERGWGAIISCIPGKLGYYYDECGARRALLMRSSAPPADQLA